VALPYLILMFFALFCAHKYVIIPYAHIRYMFLASNVAETTARPAVFALYANVALVNAFGAAHTIQMSPHGRK